MCNYKKDELIKIVSIEKAIKVLGLREKTIVKLCKERGYGCKHCGSIATEMRFYWSETNCSVYRSLFGIDNNGNSILFTIDHIKPKSRGGRNQFKNYQLLCTKCNQKKDNKTESEIKKENKDV